MSVIIPTQPATYLDGMRAINQACNTYLSNQTPLNAEAVSNEARQFVAVYLISFDEDIKPIVNGLNVALKKNRASATNAEGQLVEDIKACVDIIEPENLVLTIKE